MNEALTIANNVILKLSGLERKLTKEETLCYEQCLRTVKEYLRHWEQLSQALIRKHEDGQV